jgi:FMN phosphatase YigB (HAD superfamily)
MADDVVFLFDVDNTLLDNDRFQKELREHLTASYGNRACDRYWAIFEDLWSELGYADYLGAVERYRLENRHSPHALRMARFILDYPFAGLLYPGAFEAVRYAKRFGAVVLLSDGDAVFQPRKIDRSGLWEEFGGNALIYVHKQEELQDVERSYPAACYVLIDDKLAILDSVKQSWGDRVTTVFPRQGHYAFDPEIVARHRAADVTIDSIADLATVDLTALKRS